MLKWLITKCKEQVYQWNKTICKIICIQYMLHRTNSNQKLFVEIEHIIWACWLHGGQYCAADTTTLLFVVTSQALVDLWNNSFSPWILNLKLWEKVTNVLLTHFFPDWIHFLFVQLTTTIPIVVETEVPFSKKFRPEFSCQVYCEVSTISGFPHHGPRLRFTNSVLLGNSW